jgi:hypothetical protein
MKSLLHGETEWLSGDAVAQQVESIILSGISSAVEEAELESLNVWIEEQGLPRGIMAYDFADPETGVQKAVFDLAWPDGLQAGLSQPIAVLLNEEAQIIALASQAGFKCFTSSEQFKNYVLTEAIVG